MVGSVDIRVWKDVDTRKKAPRGKSQAMKMTENTQGRKNQAKNQQHDEHEGSNKRSPREGEEERGNKQRNNEKISGEQGKMSNTIIIAKYIQAPLGMKCHKIWPRGGMIKETCKDHQRENYLH